MMSEEQKIKTLMTIDDNEVDQMLYKRIIDRSGIVENTIAFQLATDALTYLKSSDCEEIDVILLDINMPLMNGFEFLEQLSEDFDSEFSPFVVIMLTTSLDPRDRERAEAFHMVKAQFNKPLVIEDIAKIAGLLKQLKK